MKPVTFKVDITGVSPLLFNRKEMMIETLDDPSLTKQKGETDYAHQLRIWKLKAHSNKDGKLFIPETWIRKALIATQRQNAFPIKPAGARMAKATLQKQLVSGLFVENSYLDGKTVNDLEPLKSICTIPSTGGSILVIRPYLNKWSASLSVTITDAELNEKIIRSLLEWVGIYSGIGEWRPANGGAYGRFQIS